jgi:hypothetical protein
LQSEEGACLYNCNITFTMRTKQFAIWKASLPAAYELQVTMI